MSCLKEKAILRIRINERHWGRERYEAREAISENIEFTKIEIKSKDDKQFVLHFGPSVQAYKAIVTLSPFRVDVFTGERLVISGNARGFLKFEHSRPKPVEEDNAQPQNEVSTKRF